VPYPSNERLPDNVKVLPEAAQTIFRKAFNSALKQYRNEDQARKVAWSTVKRKYIKKGDKWILKEITQSFLNLICERIQSFSQNELIDLIPKDTLAEIKQKNDHPYFAAYSICHEGESTPKIIGEGFKPILWTRRAVQSLKRFVLKGIKFFLGHNDDNSTNNRQSVGEVVADAQKEINGKLHHIVVGYFPNKQIVANKDICSQEGNWNLFEMAKRLVADSVDKITGIALGSSDNNSPAFAEAKRLGMVQAFNTPGEGDKNTSGKEGKMPDEIKSYHDLKKYITQFNVFPSQLFTLDEIKKDREFITVFNEAEILKKQLEEKDKQIEDFDNKHKELDRQLQLSTAKTRLKNMMSNFKDSKGNVTEITPKQQKYIELNFSESLDDLTDEGLSKFIAKTLESDYKKNAEFFGTSDSVPEITDEGGTIDKTDMTKKDNNPLLEEDLDND